MKTTVEIFNCSFLINLGREERTRCGNRTCQIPRPVSGGSLPTPKLHLYLLTPYNRPASSRSELKKKTLQNEVEKKDTEREGERNGKQPKAFSFSATAPHSTQDSRSSIARPRFFLRSPSFLPSIQRCLSSSPAPKAPTFPPLSLGVYGLVRCRKQRISLCCFAAGFVRSWELNPCSIVS